MSSVQRFLKQIPAANSQFNPVASSSMYTFTPASANVVGNYPPGTLALVSGDVQLAIDVALTKDTCVMRDMGKTIYAPISTGTSGYFRQVQVLFPEALPAGGFIGGINGSKFGVSGISAGNNFLVVYVPVAVNGIVASDVAFPAPEVTSAGSL
jgi:hypothetical protein